MLKTVMKLVISQLALALVFAGNLSAVDAANAGPAGPAPVSPSVAVHGLVNGILDLGLQYGVSGDEVPAAPMSTGVAVPVSALPVNNNPSASAPSGILAPAVRRVTFGDPVVNYAAVAIAVPSQKMVDACSQTDLAVSEDYDSDSGACIQCRYLEARRILKPNERFDSHFLKLIPERYCENDINRVCGVCRQKVLAEAIVPFDLRLAWVVLYKAANGLTDAYCYSHYKGRTGLLGLSGSINRLTNLLGRVIAWGNGARVRDCMLLLHNYIFINEEIPLSRLINPTNSFYQGRRVKEISTKISRKNTDSFAVRRIHYDEYPRGDVPGERRKLYDLGILPDVEWFSSQEEISNLGYVMPLEEKHEECFKGGMFFWDLRNRGVHAGFNVECEGDRELEEMNLEQIRTGVPPVSTDRPEIDFDFLVRDEKYRTLFDK